MLIRNLFAPWRHNVAIHATLITREVTPIDGATRELVAMDNGEKIHMKFRGETNDGIEVFVDLELIGPPELLKQFQFKHGQHAGMVLRAID